MSDQPVAAAPTCKTYIRQERRTFMPSAGFETVIPASTRLQVYALDRPATWIGPTPDI